MRSQESTGKDFPHQLQLYSKHPITTDSEAFQFASGGFRHSCDSALGHVLAGLSGVDSADKHPVVEHILSIEAAKLLQVAWFVLGNGLFLVKPVEYAFPSFAKPRSGLQYGW